MTNRYKSDCVSCQLYEKPSESEPGKWCSFCYLVFALEEDKEGQEA